MQNLLLYIVQVNILLSILFVGYYVLLRKLTFYKLNRMYFLFGWLYALLYPILNVRAWFTQTMDMHMPQAWQYLPDTWRADAITTGATFTLDRLVLLALGLGAGILLLRFGIQLWSVYRIHAHSRLTQWQQYLFRNVPYPILPFSFFDNIYVHRSQHSEPELHDIFEHEHIHVTGHHTLDILLFEMLWISCWYNPLVWLMRSAVRQNLEYLTDQQVLNKGVDRQAYQYSLVHVSRHGAAIDIGNQFNLKTLKSRIMMMNKKRSSPFELSKYVFLLPVLILFGASFTVSKTETHVEKAVASAQETDVSIWVNPKNNTPQENDSDVEVVRKPKENGISNLLNTGEQYSSKLPQSAMTDSMLYIVDGVPTSLQEVRQISPDNIESISVVKDHTVLKKYGNLGKNGVIVITTKTEARRTLRGHRVDSVSIHIDNTTGSSTIILDSKAMPEGFDLSEIDAEAIESVSIHNTEGEGGGKKTVTITRKQQSDNGNQPSRVTIRGVRSTDSTGHAPAAHPLVLIDGQEMSADFDLSTVPSGNIQSVKVLKGKSVTEQYGEKAEGGVIDVTTKDGKPL